MSSAIHIAAMDGYPLTGTAYEPVVPNGCAVLIAGGTGILRRYYDRLARFLQEQGFSAVTLDYRGIGDSRPPVLKGFSAHMHTWGEQDMAGALQWMAQTWEPTRIVVVGHSAGGQLIGLLPNSHLVDAVVLVAAQSGYWKHWPLPRRLPLALLWYLVIPVLSNTLGYFPAKWLRLGEDLPKDVALEWASWCRHPRYLFGFDETLDLSRYPTLTVPILVYSFSDDTFAPASAVEALLDEYAGADITRNYLSPASLHVRTVGHFGFFREHFRDTLWREMADWMHRQA